MIHFIKRLSIISICTFLVVITGCSSNSDDDSNAVRVPPDIDIASPATGTEETNNDETNQERPQSVCVDSSGSTGPAPIDTGFWKETDDRLVLYRYSTERGDNGEYAEITDLHRSQMNAQTLEYLENITLNIYSVEDFLRHKEYREDDSIVCVAEELTYPDCQPLAATGSVFDIAVSSGSVGEPVIIISSNACGQVDLFNPSSIDGVVNPHDLLTTLPQVVNQ